MEEVRLPDRRRHPGARRAAASPTRSGGRSRPRCRWPRSGARTCRPRSPPTARSRPRGRSTSRPPSRARSPTSPSRKATASRRGSSCSRSTRSNPRAAARSTRGLDAGAAARARLGPRPAARRPGPTSQRAEENHQAGIIPEADLQRARTALDHAPRPPSAPPSAASSRRAPPSRARRTRSSKTTVRAPMDGIVTAKRVEEGEVAVDRRAEPARHRAAARSPTCRSSRPRWRWTRPRSRRSSSARRRWSASTPTRTRPSTASSPRWAAARSCKTGRHERGDQVQGQDPDQGPARRTSSRASRCRPTSSPASARRRWWCRSRRWWCATSSASPARRRKPGAPRDEEGVYLMEGGKARFQAIKTGLLGELSLEVVDGPQGRRDADHRARSRRCAA